MHKILLLLCILSITFCAKAQIGKWTPGYYYDLNNNKISGEIKHNYPNRSIFKGVGDQIQFRTADTVKKEKISTDKIKSFVILTDSFVVSHNKELELYPVLRVWINNQVKLYQSLRWQSSGSGYQFSSYVQERQFYGENPDSVTELTRGKFIEAMSQVLADNNGIVLAIKNKEYRYGKLYELIKQYNIFKEHPIE